MSFVIEFKKTNRDKQDQVLDNNLRLILLKIFIDLKLALTSLVKSFNFVFKYNLKKNSNFTHIPSFDHFQLKVTSGFNKAI